jgi:hypothetical protein
MRTKKTLRRRSWTTVFLYEANSTEEPTGAMISASWHSLAMDKKLDLAKKTARQEAPGVFSVLSIISIGKRGLS